ncbi:MAG: hypothetical protein K8W52_22010 [Deltaproteobacteria bacterium]|nr:hypothetical protein [Deltaproteobacteria bacterium]
MRSITKLLLAAPFAAMVACAPIYADGGYSAGYSAGYGTAGYGYDAYATGPELAYVEPGVEVVAGWDTPVFFVDDAFWFWDGGLWYRSAYWGGPRVYVRDVPTRITHIPRPQGYAHYRPSGPTRRIGVRGGAPGTVRPMPPGRGPMGPMRPTVAPGRPAIGPRPTQVRPVMRSVAPGRPAWGGGRAPRPRGRR